jgi:hypothetical protein
MLGAAERLAENSAPLQRIEVLSVKIDSTKRLPTHAGKLRQGSLFGGSEPREEVFERRRDASNDRVLEDCEISARD